MRTCFTLLFYWFICALIIAFIYYYAKHDDKDDL